MGSHNNYFGEAVPQCVPNKICVCKNSSYFHDNYSLILEALPGRVPVRLFPEIFLNFPLFPKIKIFNFVCSLLPEITFVLLFPSFLDLCSSVSLK